MKKTVFLIIGTLLCLSLLSSCKKEPREVPVKSVLLSDLAVDLHIGDTKTLSATVGPENATNKSVTWSSSNTSVATVSNGVVIAVNEGTAIIMATAEEVTAMCVVKVLTNEVTGISLDITSASLKVNENITLTATVTPANATDKTVTWSSSNDGIATVKDGVVTAVSLGTATVTAQSGDKTATCEITVEATPVTSVTLDKTSVSLKVKETATLTATVAPDDATDKTVTWTSSNDGIVSVDDGVVTALKLGTATITAKAGDQTATCEITVEATPVTSITLDRTSVSLRTNETVTLTATVNPDDATDKTVTWSSSNSYVATVKDGVVTAVSPGTATITARAGDQTASCVITVEATQVTGISLNKTSVSLKVNESVTLTATVTPAYATDKTVTWSSSNTGVATVKNGVVTAVKAGTATITAKAGTKSATCTVTVTSSGVDSGSNEDVGYEDWTF